MANSSSLFQQANIDAAMESKRPRTMLIEPLFLKEKGLNSEPETNVVQVLDIPLPFGDENGYRPGAVNWDDYVKSSTDPNPDIWCLQLMLGMMEQVHGLGSLQCKVNKAKNPSFYRRMVDLQAKKRCGAHGYKISKDEERTLNSHVVMCNTFDPQFASDVHVRIKWLIKQKQKKKPRRNGGDEGDGDDAEDIGERDSDDERDQAQDVEQEAPPSYEEWRASFALGEGEGENIFFFNHWRLAESHVMVDAEELPPTGSVFERLTVGQRDGIEEWGHLFPAPEARLPPPPVAAQAAGEGEDEGSGYDDSITLPTVVPKMVFTITCVGPSDRPKGILARFIIKDAALNPGLFLCSVIDNRKSRLTKRGHIDPFASYSIYFNTQHPLGNHTDEDKYARICLGLNPDLCPNERAYLDFMYNLNMVDTESPTHLRNLLTTERALQVFETLGWRMNTLEDWYSRARATANFPPGFLTHKTLPQQAFWYNGDYLGLMEQQFPHVDGSSRLLDCLLSGENMDVLLKQRLEAAGRMVADHGDFEEDALDAQNMAKVQETKSRIQHILSNQPVVRRRDIANLSLVPYDTNNEFVHRHTDAKKIYGKLQTFMPANVIEVYEEAQRLKRDLIEEGRPADEESWRARFAIECSPELQMGLAEYDMYCRLITNAQDEMMNTYKTLWNPKGDIENIPIPEQIRCMLRWWRQVERTGIRNVSRPYVQWDVNLDMFGNTQLQTLSFFVTFGRVIQPMICMLLEGLFSAYDPDMRQVAFNIMLHGEKEAGKTYPGIVILKQFMCILGTVQEIHAATKASDITDRHCYDEIMAVDECPEWMVSEQEAKKYPDLVNKEKLKLVSGQMQQRTFMNIKLPSGEEYRWYRDVINDHKRATIWISNSPAEQASALSSRMFRFTVKQSKIPANELNKHIGDFTNNAAIFWLNLNQYLTCCLKKAAAVGALFPTPAMELFDNLMKKTEDTLKRWNADTSQIGNRTKDILAPLMRQMIDKTAVRYVFDMPFSPYYKKPFETHMIRACQRYRYATVSQYWWVITSCVDSILNTDDSNVLTALVKMSKVDWNIEQGGEDAYQRFALDVDNKIPWRTRRNPNMSRAEAIRIAASAGVGEDANDKGGGGKEPQEAELTDLNYICIPMTLDQAAKTAAATTEPRLDPAACLASMKRMEHRFIHPPYGGFELQPKNAFAYWHKYTRLPDPTADPILERNRHFGEKRLGRNCPKQYLRPDEIGEHNPERQVNDYRNQNDVRAYGGEDAKLQVVDLSGASGHPETSRIYFMPNAVNMYRRELILDVLVSVITCGSTRPGKYLQGFADSEDPSILSVTTLTQESIHRIVDCEDRAAGYYIDPENRDRIQFMDASVPESQRPVPRRKGLQFNNRGAVDDLDINKVAACPIVPTALSDEEWRRQVHNEMSQLKEEVEVIEDLDYFSARLQHLRTGQSLDEPVHSPAYMQRLYDEYMASVPQNLRPSSYAASDYPRLEQERLQRRSRKWRHASASMVSKRIYDEEMKIIRQNSTRPWSQVIGLPVGQGGQRRPREDEEVPPLVQEEPMHIRNQRQKAEKLRQKKQRQKK